MDSHLYEKFDQTKILLSLSLFLKKFKDQKNFYFDIFRYKNTVCPVCQVRRIIFPREKNCMSEYLVPFCKSFKKRKILFDKDFFS